VKVETETFVNQSKAISRPRHWRHLTLTTRSRPWMARLNRFQDLANYSTVIRPSLIND